MFRAWKTHLFWIGLAVLTVSSLALSALLWLIFVYYPSNYGRLHWDYPTYFPTYFWQYYVWYILGGVVFIVIGSFMVRAGLRKQSSS